MQIIHGEFPTSVVWRVAVVLNPHEGMSLPWQLGEMLAKANRGAALAAIILDEQAGSDQLVAAEQTLQQIADKVSVGSSFEQLLIRAADPERALRDLITRANVDLLITDLDTPVWRNLNNLPCTVAALRFGRNQATHLLENGIQRILMPTSGGPHTASALQFLVQLPEAVEIEALYVSRDEQGYHEEALGHARLDQMLEFVEAADRVRKRVIRSSNPMHGIVEYASKGADLVVLGASQESSLDRALFGDVVSAVVRESQVPVMVVRRPRRRTSDFFSRIDWRIQQVVPRLTPEERRDVYVRIRDNARPDFDYFVLITLSAAIAALGLILNSPAVVIGAMLVAPLMSPIVATGMAFILGDIRFLRYAGGSALRGAFVALLVGALTGLIIPGDNLTAEVLARTQPSLLDLGVALFSGLAGAFAISYWQAAGALPGVAIAAALVPPIASAGIAFSQLEWRLGFNALLLFTTNFITIALAAAFVFLVFGFRPNPTAKAQRLIQQRTARVAFFSLLILTLILTPTTFALFGESRRVALTEQVASEQVTSVLGITAVTTSVKTEEPNDSNLNHTVLELMVQSAETPTDEQIALLQQQIYDNLSQSVTIDTPFQLRLIHQKVSAPAAILSP